MLVFVEKCKNILYKLFKYNKHTYCQGGNIATGNDWCYDTSKQYLECVLSVIENFKSYRGNISALNGMQVEFISAFSSVTKLKEVYVFTSGNKTEFWLILDNKTYSDSKTCLNIFRSFCETKKIDIFECLILDEEQLDRSNMPQATCSFYKS